MSEHPTCPAPGCRNFSRAKTRPTYCLAHYQLEYRGIDPATRRVPNVREESTCDVDGCRSPKVNTRVCSTHYHQVRMGELVIPGYSPKLFPPCQGPDCEKRGRWSGYCTTHGGHIQREGRPRKVVFQREVPCGVEGCEEVSHSKGLCNRHYAIASRPEPRDKPPCSVEGCTRRTYRGMCSIHVKAAKEVEKREARKAARLAAIELLPVCPFPKCTDKISYTRGGVCDRHHADRARKKLPLDRYIALITVQECEACGGGVGRLVTDHKHGHHARDSDMCPDCIRGRLCNGCNSALGMLGEDEARMEGLLAYIRRFHGDPVRSGV